MATRDSNGQPLKYMVSGPGIVVARRRNGRGSRKKAMEVQLTHAMDQIAADVKQAIEAYTREAVTASAASE